MVLSGRLQTVLQATVGNGLSFDPLSFGQDRRAAPAVDVGRSKIVDAKSGRFQTERIGNMHEASSGVF